MKLHVHFDTPELRVDEVVEGQNAEAVVAAMQSRVAKELGFIKGAVVRSMSPLAFAQQATRMYNSAMKTSAPIPATCEEFLNYGVEQKFASWVDEGGQR